MAIKKCMVVLRPIPTSAVDIGRMLLHTQVSWRFTAAWRCYQWIKSSLVTWVFISPDEPYPVLYLLAYYMANITIREEDGAHGLFSIRMTDKHGFSSLWFDFMFISSPFWSFSKYLSTFILTEMCGTIPADQWCSALAALICEAMNYPAHDRSQWGNSSLPKHCEDQQHRYCQWNEMKEQNPCSSAREHKHGASPLCPHEPLHLANKECV